ncbi:MAG: NAD-dependent epimerase [Crocinitomicaceae bacterium]|nr:NAD-dependent epimerase [Crocinitomicaceae bacterium]
MKGENNKRLIIGAGGQIGGDLVEYLRGKYGNENVVATDIKQLEIAGPTEQLDVMDLDALRGVIEKHNTTEVYLLAALLSASAELKPQVAWDLNMKGLFNVLNLAKEGLIKKVFWPSSIAVFGPSTPKESTPQNTIMDPNTVYGISKLAGERWCEYYHNKYGVDVRSIRYPGLISWKTKPGGGTTDYAIDIFYSALQNEIYTCFLKEDRALPMMYMDDAVRATVQLMEAPKENITVRSSYNLGGVSFKPTDIARAIRKRIKDFGICYQPDFRDEIAQSWPHSIDDQDSQKDWNWKNKYELEEIVEVMLHNLSEKLQLS